MRCDAMEHNFRVYSTQTCLEPLLLIIAFLIRMPVCPLYIKTLVIYWWCNPGGLNKSPLKIWLRGDYLKVIMEWTGPEDAPVLWMGGRGEAQAGVCHKWTPACCLALIKTHWAMPLEFCPNLQQLPIYNCYISCRPLVPAPFSTIIASWKSSTVILKCLVCSKDTDCPQMSLHQRQLSWICFVSSPLKSERKENTVSVAPLK